MHRRRNDDDLIPVEKRKRVIMVDNDRGRRRGLRGLKLVLYSFSALLLLLIISAIAGFVAFQSSLSKVKKAANKAVPEIREVGNGIYELSWAELENLGADTYHVEIRSSFSESGEDPLFSADVDGVSCRLPSLPRDEFFVLQIDLIKKYNFFGEEHVLTQASIERNFHIRDPIIKDLDWKANLETGIVSISYDFRDGNSCSIYVVGQDGERKLLRTVEENSLELNFNEEENLWVPTPGNSCVLSLVPGNLVGKMAVYGGDPKEIIVSWEDFASRDINLSLEMLNECVCRLEWDRVDCDSYEIQMLDQNIGTWKTVKTVTRDSECTYDSPRLNPGSGYSFRIAAVLKDSMAVSEVRECDEIAVTPLYCTIWPVKALDAYSDAEKSSVAGRVKAMGAYCVLDVENDMFGVDVDGRICYIDSNYCMINLAEYVGSLCNYDITNSYSSIFMAHGFGMDNLTGEVISGYEDVQLDDSSFLVPLLYPTARKLETAIESAREKGYRLKIYDAFRPHEASVYMYQTVSALQHKTLPEETYRGIPAGVSLTTQTTDENGVTTERRKTYAELMNGNQNSFSIGAFVSAGVSRHNIGVAMDLTLENLDTGYEVLMQTDMHDLSHYSALSENIKESKALAQIMLSAGYNSLYSEWWHFQDDEIKGKLSLPCINEGVSPECWMFNGVEWRYRGVDGNYAVDCTLTIDGEEYVFDADGYTYTYTQN